MASNKHVQIIDLRIPIWEVSGNSITNSINIPYLLGNSMNDGYGVFNTNFLTEFKAKVEPKLGTVLMCGSGQRAFGAAQLLQALSDQTTERQCQISYIGTGGVPDFLLDYYPADPVVDGIVPFPPAHSLSASVNSKCSPDVAMKLIQLATANFTDMSAVNLIDVRFTTEWDADRVDPSGATDTVIANGVVNYLKDFDVVNIPTVYNDPNVGYDSGISGETMQSAFNAKGLDYSKPSLM